MVHLRLQPSTRDRGERPVAAFRTIRSRSKRQSDPRLADQQVQGIRLRHHDKLRRGRSGHPIAERVHVRQPGAASQLQNQQEQNVLDRLSPRAY